MRCSAYEVCQRVKMGPAGFVGWGITGAKRNVSEGVGTQPEALAAAVCLR
jgi:hypothetical protein